MKSITSKLLTFAALVTALSCMPHAAWAVNNCPGATVTATALSFGTYDSVSGAAVTSSATVTVKCNGGTVEPIATIQLNAGLHSAGSFNPRLMQNTALTDTLNYNLYVTTSYVPANIWGDGTSGTLDPGGNTTGVNGNNVLVVTVNGQIPVNQDPIGVCPATPCTYNDTVTVTVNF
jgi:spore coat protein U-like protein